MNRTKGTYENYGHKLYEEGKRLVALREQFVRQQEELQKAKDELESTFKPKVSAESMKLLSQKRNFETEKREDAEFVNRMHQSQRKSEENRERVADLVRSESSKECTFKPSLNKTSEKLIRDKERQLHFYNMDHYELLFKDAERRKLKKEEQQCSLPDDATFKPQVSRLSNTMIMPEETEEEFLHRLVYSKKEVERNLERIRERLDSAVDPVTGQEWFKPIVTEKQRRYPIQGSVYEELFQSRTDYEQQRKALIHSHEQVIQQQANMTHLSSESERVLRQGILKKLHEIFDYFDVDSDGYIYLKQVDCNSASLEPELAKELTSMFQEMEQDKALLSFDEFYEAMMKRFDNWTLPKATMLHSFSAKRQRNNKEDDKECTFKPKLNKNSQVMAKEKRVVSMYPQVLFLEKDKYDHRLELLKKEKEQKEVQDCSFKPKLIAKHVPVAANNEVSTRLFNKSKTVPTNNQVTTSEEKEVLEHCSFAPKLCKTNENVQPLSPNLRDVIRGETSYTLEYLKNVDSMAKRMILMSPTFSRRKSQQLLSPKDLR